MTITDIKEVEKVIKALQKAKQLDKKFKVLRVGRAKWTNSLTMEMQITDNIYFLGFPSAVRPLMINYFNVSMPDSYETYRITTSYTHANVCDGCDRYYYEIELDGKKGSVEFIGQEFCNPITANHIYEANDKDMAGLLKATLLSQNFDDAYGDILNVKNYETDHYVKCRMNGNRLLKHNASELEILLGYSTNAIYRKSEYEINALLRDLISIEKDEVWVKRKEDWNYTKIKKSEYNANKKDYSSYYPAYDYNRIKRMKIAVPKDSYDLGVFGLGSAGTAILDQICRSNWVSSIYLCDFDKVEPKNQINQWYDRYDVSKYKTQASYDRILELERTMEIGAISTKFFVEYDSKKFQETPIEQKKFKYVVSGFDSIKVRKEFFDAILDGKIETRYLIDCRYLDLASSIYFIDLEDSEQVELYRANLQADAELIEERNLNECLTEEEFDEWVYRKGFYNSGCYRFRKNILKEEGNSSDTCKPRLEGFCSCASEDCKKHLYELYKKSLPNPDISVTDASCIKYNYIDIYKYVGAIVFGAFRKIENGENKPFTLVEAQTDIKGLPNLMVVKE